MPETYRTVSLIPFQLSPTGNIKVVDGNYLTVRERDHRESILVGKTKFSFQVKIPGTVADLDIFDGDIGIITVTMDHAINSNIPTEEQIYNILAERKAMHRKFLDGSDSVVSAIESELKKIFAPSRCDIAMSYVFTIYAFPDEEWVKPELLMAIFQPSMVGIDDSLNFDEKIEEIEKITGGPSKEWLKDNNSDIRNGVTGLISWSSVIVIAGKYDYVKDYVYLEKRLQHAWLSLYTNTAYLSSIIERKLVIGSQEINRIREDASFEILEVDEILDPSIPGRHSIILEKMIETSNFDKLKQKINAQLKFLDIKAMKQRENNQNLSNRLVTSFLFLIALITAYRSLSSLMISVVGPLYSNLLAFIVLVAIFTVFEVIIFRRFER